MMFQLLIIFIFISASQGADFFESLLLRLECYQKTQDNCNDSRDFIEAYPELASSVTNTTKADTHFYMFSKNNSDVPELMHKCAGELPMNTNFNPKCRTEIFFPGFVSGICNYAIFRELKDERLKCGCYNVLLVDWMWGNSLDMVVAQKNMAIVAKQLAIVIRKLKLKFNLGPEAFIISGHSYGAHGAAITSNHELVQIINGIEPAGVMAPYAESAPLDERLDPGDAPCVNVLHTNAGQCLPGYFGVNYSCGTTDVWYNGGKWQPACYPQTLISFMKGDWIYALFSLIPAACSHFQALQYYKSSMNPDGYQFTGLECNSTREFNSGSCGRDCGNSGEKCAVVGAYGCDCAKSEGHKNYYLNTTSLCPFCDKNSPINANSLTCGGLCMHVK